MEYYLEVIAFNPGCCVDIEAAGAHRIELCSGPAEGGTTPSHGFIKEARQKVNIELFPIIRPRGGDFLYTDSEFRIMMDDVAFCKSAGCDGVVTGILNADGTVDKRRCAILTKIAYPMSVTFHRAFDRTAEPFKAMEDIISIGADRILTSGLKPTATEGLSLIRQLVKKADSRITIMPGSGIRSGNIADIVLQSGTNEFHSSARKLSTTLMEYHNTGMNEQLGYAQVDKAEVEKMISALSGIKPVL